MTTWKLMANKWLRWLKRCWFRNSEKKMKSLFMIYIDFKSIIIRGGNEKQNADESCPNKYKNMFLTFMVIN